jgi:hypothetical protein
VAAVENHAKLGLLADAFGSYGAARIFFLRWSGTGLAKQAQADIEGAVHDIAQGSLGGYAGIIAVPYTSAAKTTAVSIFKAD